MRNPVFLFFAVLALGVWGYLDWEARLAGAAFVLSPKVIADAFYRSLQLFTINVATDHFGDPIPWQLQIGRFAAPVLTVWALVRLFSNALMPIPNALWSRLWGRDEFVVVGYGDTGQALARAISDLEGAAADEGSGWWARHLAKPRIVAVGADVEDADIADAAREGIELYRRDIRLGTRWSDRGKGLRRAKRVLVALNSDADTLEVGRILLHRHTLSPQNVWLHIKDEDLLDRLRDADAIEARSLRGNARVFGLTEAAVEQMIAEAAPLRTAHAKRQARLHAVLVGEGAQMRAVVEGLALYGTFPPPSLARPRITFLSANAGENLRQLKARHPDLEDWVDMTAIDAAMDSISWLDGSPVLDQIECLDPPSLYLFAIPSEKVGLPHALALRRAMALGRAAQAPVHIFSRFADDLRDPSAEAGCRIDEGLFLAGNLRRAAHFSVALNPQLERVARAFHDQWSRNGGPGYDDLTETLRNSNWRAALHAIQKLAALGFEEVDARKPCFDLSTADLGWLEAAIASEDGPLDGLAHYEHVRWCVDRVLDGWKPGAPSSTGARVRTQLAHGRREYAALSDQERAKDSDQVVTLIEHFRDRIADRADCATLGLNRIAIEQSFRLRWHDSDGWRFEGDAPDIAALLGLIDGLLRLRITVPRVSGLSGAAETQAATGLADLAQQLLESGDGRCRIRFERLAWDDWAWMSAVDRLALVHVEAVTLSPLTVGFVGHRDIARLNTDAKTLRQAIGKEFGNLAADERPLRLVTGAAEGADTLAIEAWHELRTGTLRLLYPDGAHATSAKERGIATHADCDATLGAEGSTDHQLVSQQILDSANVLIAAYDGNGSKGAGGTGETVAIAENMGRMILRVP